MKRIPELDGIRGLAIAMVLLWHFVFFPIEAAPRTVLAYFKASGRLTWSGVDLFFVLSGFLIGGILLDSRERADYFRSFYLRRLFRIVPLYVALLLLTLAVNRGLIDPQIPTLSYFAFLQNFWMARFATLGALLGATWSLAVEEQFYLTLPSVIRFVKPRYLFYALAAGILAAPGLRMLCLHLWPMNALVYFVLTPCRADALLLGVIGAMAMRDARVKSWLERNGRAVFAVLLIGLAGAALLTRYQNHQFAAQVVLSFTWLAGLYLCMILFVITQTKSWLARAMRWRWLRWLGSIAYGVYLVHQSAFVLIFRGIWPRTDLHLHGWSSIGAMALTLAVTLAICQLSWHYFEKPLVQIGHRHD